MRRMWWYGDTGARQEFCQGPCFLSEGEVLECGAALGATYTSQRVATQAPEINRSVVAACISIAIGHTQHQKMCEVMGMPSLHMKSFQAIFKGVHKRAIHLVTSTTAHARQIVRELHTPEEDGLVNIPVTFDGTWHKRGHTSLHGAAAVICAVTGLVLDTHVMSLHCQLYKTKRQQLSVEEFTAWQLTHKEGCQVSYAGTSGRMEVEAANVIWTRSSEYGLRYTTIISDGDLKTFNALLALKPYGNVPIEKAECVNHVAKRIGTALRNLVSDEKKRGLTLGGRGEGTLALEKMGKLQAYYTKAVLGYNNSVEEMSAAIWATFDHCRSTDDSPHHDRCPQGGDSWCFFQRAKANNQAPSSHRDHQTTFLNETVAPCLEMVHQHLTEPELLKKCLLGKTQNANESFHSQTLLRCPKHIFYPGQG